MDRTTTFEFILIDGFSMLSVVAAIEPLRVANRILGEKRYAWRMLHEEGANPQASNHLGFPCSPFETQGTEADYTFVCAGMHTSVKDPKRLNVALNRRHRGGGAVGGVSLAPLLLARAGLLSGRKAVIHWEGLANFKEEFPQIEVSTGLYMIDGDIITSCGGLATLDLFLEILGRDHEPWLVQAVSNQLQVAKARAQSELQHVGFFRLPVTAPRAMHKAIALIDQHIAAPLSPEKLAAEAGVSRRTLDRRFKDYTGQSATEFYLSRRLERAKTLLLHSNMTILEVAIATGFVSASHFAATFRSEFGQSPSACREKARNSDSF